MRVLVTGIGGFIGSKVSQRLLSEGYSVYGVDDFSTGKIENVPEGIEVLAHDLSDKAIIAKLPPKINIILHLAGQSSGEKSFDDPLRDMDCNVSSTLNLIRYGIQHKVERIIYASSMSVYGPTANTPIDETHQCSPLSCYGVGKLSAEAYLKVFQAQLPFVAFRIFNVYGPGQNLADLRQGMVSIFLAQALKDGNVTVKGSLERFRDFIYIDDVVEAWVRAMTSHEAKNKIINLGTGRQTIVQELLQQFKTHIPNTTWNVKGSTPGDQNGVFANNSLLKDVLKMNKFTSLEDGLKIFADSSKQAK